MLDKDFNFVIAGGGTAGWLTALFLRKFYPDSNVTLIASSEIGILGAGEGTTPHMVHLLRELNLDVGDVFRHAKGTVKSGIKFTNWNGDGESYYHPFSQLHQFEHTMFADLWTGIGLMDLELIAQGKNLDSLTLSALAAEQNKVPLKKNLSPVSQEQQGPGDTLMLGSIALHFDANLLAKYLERVGSERNIKLVDARIVGFDTDEQGYINNIKLENDGNVPCSFVFDCTGFKRLIIGDFYKSKWVSYRESLPVNTAIPFFIPHDNNTSPCTESIAMKYGWQWKIPVQGRYGCGYVFDNDYISPEEAKRELDEMYGFEVDSPRTFKFNAGCYEKNWVNNCVALGLSSGFIEPLEATSIWVTITSLHYFVQNISGVMYRDQFFIDRYNEKVKAINDSVLEFLHFHYLTKRSDSKFWTEFRHKNKPTEGILKLLEEIKHTVPTNDFFKDRTDFFPPASWLYVAAGLKFYDKDIAQKLFDSLTYGHRMGVFQDVKTKYLKRIESNLGSLLNHEYFIHRCIDKT